MTESPRRHAAFPRRSTRGAASCALLAAAACAKVPPQTAAMRARPEVVVSADQLQMRDYELGRELAGMIVAAADSILAASDSPPARMRALQWKVAAVPLVQEASVRDDPLISAADLAAFSLQQVDYFTTGDGRAAFGAQQPVAVQAARAMETVTFRALGRSLQSGAMAPAARDSFAVWAAQNPMRGPDMLRPTVLGAGTIDAALGGASLAATAGNIDRTMRLVTLRLGLLNESLSDRVRWTADLTLAEMLAAPRGDTLILQSAQAVREVGTFTHDFPAILTTQVDALMAGVDHQRALALADVDRQRVATIADLRTERVALEAAIARERTALMADVAQERVAIAREADSVAARTVDRTEAAMRRVVLEALAAALVAIAALTGGAMLVVRHWRATALRVSSNP
ncbi:MAG TPA: hypothetical protein VMT93_01475 [Gemmatimonadaceae bacterium]|nr:hypothetical protein [Gemmatimonadaceae bacterium]